MFSPNNPPTDFLYLESDIPPGVGLREWRHDYDDAQRIYRRRRLSAKVLAAMSLAPHGDTARAASVPSIRFA